MSNPISQPKEPFRTLTNLDELKAGMVIAEDIVNQRGNVLIAAGFVVDNEKKLKQFLNLHKVETLKIRVPRKPSHSYTNATKGSTMTAPAKDAAVEATPPPPAPVKTPELSPVPHRIDPAVVQAEEERRYQQKRIQETKAFQNRYYEQRDTLKNDFERIVHGDPITKDELEDRVADILKGFDSTINVFQLIETIKKDARDLFAHYYHVTLISHYIGTWLDLTPEQLQDLTLAALLHDIGKEQISPDLILKQHELTEEEQEAYQQHVVMGYELVKKHDFITHGMMQAILLHHERIDGSGYPLGIRGDKIPLLAKIVAVADVYNTLTMPDGKERKKTPFQAVKIMERDYMSKLDTRILYVFLNRIGNCFLGQEVKLNDQRIGEIIFVPRVYVYRPIIKLKTNNQLLDLSDPQNKNVDIHSFA